jgi:hypothetical protein
MVIDADQESIFQSLKPRAMDTVTLQNDRSFISACHTVCLHNLISEGQRSIDAGNSIVQNDIGLLSHFAQDLAAGKGRSDGVTVGTRVRGKHKSLVLSDLS